MSQLQLIALADISDPFVNECFSFRSTRPSVNCQKPGMFVELVGLFARRLNATIRFIDGKTLKNEFSLNSTSQDDIINLIRTGKIDMYSGFFDNTTNYGPGLETSSLPVYSIETKFVVAPAKRLDGVFAFFQVYSLFTWLGVLGVFLLFLFLIFVIYRWILVKIGEDGRRVKVKKLNWQLIRLEFLQYERIQEKWLSVNALVLVFALFNCGFLIQMYSSLITTQVVRPVDPKPFKETEILKVLKERRYTLLLPANFRQFYEFMTENDPAYAEMRFALEKTSVEFFGRRNEKKNGTLVPLLEKVKSGRYITILSKQAIGLTKRAGLCDFIYYDTNFPSTGRYLLLRQSPLLEKINKIILEEQINIRRLHNKYFEYVKYPPECEKPNPSEPKPLKITPFIGVLILLAIGILTGLFSFLVEFLIKKK